MKFIITTNVNSIPIEADFMQVDGHFLVFKKDEVTVAVFSSENMVQAMKAEK